MGPFDIAWGLAPELAGRQTDNEGKSDSRAKLGPGGKPPTELSLLESPKLEGSLPDSLSPHTVGTDDELPSDPIGFPVTQSSLWGLGVWKVARRAEVSGKTRGCRA